LFTDGLIEGALLRNSPRVCACLVLSSKERQAIGRSSQDNRRSMPLDL
jgi:hypothetical protein